METGVAMDVVVVVADPAAVMEDWNALADRVGTVFSSRPSFVLNVVDAVGLQCELVTVRRGGRLVALAPFAKSRKGPFTLAKIVGANLGVPLEFLSEDAEASDALLAGVARRGYMLSADSMIAGEWTVDARVRERVPVIKMGRGQTARSIRGAKSLKRLRQYRSRSASFDVETVVTVEQLERRWADILRVAETALEGSTKVNYLVSPEGEFAKDFLRAEARDGRLCVAGLVVDGVWSAHEIGVRTGNRMEGWLTHYDPSIAKLQPGHQLIEWYANNHDRLGVVELDQGVGVNRIKSTWAKAGYDVLGIAAVPNSWTFSGTLVRVLRTLPKVMSSVKKSGSAAAAALVPRR